MRKIFLWGLPGAGKTTIGRKISSLYKIPFHDLDEYIEKAEGQSISSIFDTSGESHFRTLETRYLFEVTAYIGPAVIATGGGTPCFQDNIQLMKQSGRSIYLSLPIETVFNRIKSDETQRPLFNNLSDDELYNSLRKMLDSRLPYYEKADRIINLTGTIEEDINILLPLIKKWLKV